MAKEASEGSGLGVIDPFNKGLGALPGPTTPEAVAALGWNLLREDLSLPVAVLYEDRIAHNLRWMQDFVTRYGVKLAPHGKTTMAPRLFQRQLAGGAWGITVATAPQTEAAFMHGVRRVLLANQLVGRRNREIIAGLLADPSFTFLCLVDSQALVTQLGEFFGARGQTLDVLIEAGVPGGRTGVRDEAQLAGVLRALTAFEGTLRLRGIELYEGVLQDEAAIRDFLRATVALAARLVREGRFSGESVLLSGAGSAWYDVVAEEFAKADIGAPVEIVLRPGCYLTHDVGVYKAAQARIDAHNPIAREMRSTLLPALQVWACVQSVPESERAIVALGKRDAAFDAGFPTPVHHFRPGQTAPTAAPAHWAVTGMMDQHAYLGIRAGDPIAVGDMIGFDISHPCLTFDKWRVIPVLDADYTVIDVVRTFF